MYPADEDHYWKAVLQRAVEDDGTFVYAVRTTGIFCRPSCPSRRPLRKNVAFYRDPATAMEAGYRPCLRCRPEFPAFIDPGRQTLLDLARHIGENVEEPLTLAQLAKWSGLSPSYLQKAFKRTFGVSPKVYQDALRIRHLKSGLQKGQSITRAAQDAGFSSSSRLHKQVDGNIGMTPSTYRRGGAGETITHLCKETSLGLLMLAATKRGICFVQFGDSEEELTVQLVKEFPAAQLQASSASRSPQLDAWLRALESHMQDAGPSPNLPLDLHGTAFQMAVWEFLLSIPEGSVCSYSEVAQGVGKPKAARAAASACAANRVALLVPCHRVLRGDGGLGGYRWGLERKRTLLDLERKRRSRS